MNISIAPEVLFHLGGFPITNAFLITLILSITVILLSVLFGRRLQSIPTGVQNVFELVVEGWWNMAQSISGDKVLARRFFPIVTTIFIFVLLSNWVELLPGMGTVGVYGEHHGETMLIPFLRSGSADLNMTLALAIVSVFSIQFVGIATIGVVKYAKKFFVHPLHKPYFVGTFVGLLELLSEVIRMISFSFRLFGNIFAGEVLLIVMLNLVPYIVPLPFLFLELFVGFIQAAVFAILTLVFMKMATLEAEH